jgi:hypothetical protein
MLLPTRVLSVTVTLLALALVSSPNLAHAKPGRASGQARAAGIGAAGVKTVVPSQLLVVKIKPAKNFAKEQMPVDLSPNNPNPAQANCKLTGPDQKYRMPHRRPCLIGNWVQNCAADGSDDLSDQLETDTDQTVDAVAADIDAN